MSVPLNWSSNTSWSSVKATALAWLSRPNTGSQPVGAYPDEYRNSDLSWNWQPVFYLLLTFNPLFTGQVGDNRQTDGLGFEYGWRAEYDFAKHWGIGVEMFGEIEDLSNAGSFDDQTHSLGPTLFYNPGDDSDEHDKKGAVMTTRSPVPRRWNSP